MPRAAERSTTQARKSTRGRRKKTAPPTLRERIARRMRRLWYAAFVFVVAVGVLDVLFLLGVTSPQQIRDAVLAWLMRDARRHFTERLDHFAPLLGVQWTSLRLSSAETRWGSAKADGSIRLNWRLLHYRPAVIDYVVAHELAHLRVMDHSPRFWNTVATVVPDYAALRNQLREEPAPLW